MKPDQACPDCGSSLGAIDDAPTVALVTGSFDDADQPALYPMSHSFEDGCPHWCKVDVSGRLKEHANQLVGGLNAAGL